MNDEGGWGVATNVTFTFVVATEKQRPTMFVATPKKGYETQIMLITDEWLEAQLKNPTVD